jgi:Fe-S-cluster containining protein
MYETHQQLPPPASQKQARRSLKVLYEAVPETDGCMENLNKEGGCAAWCCQLQSPQVFFSEFLNTWNVVNNSWKKEDVDELLVRSVENYLNDAPFKGCVFWDKETKHCLQHATRPFNCRTYGQIPDEEFKPRYERLKVFYADNPKADIRDQCHLVETRGKRPTPEDMNAWFNELRLIEAQMGVHPKLIHGENGGTYRTYHDHLLLMLASSTMIFEMNALKAKGTDAQKQRYVGELRKKLNGSAGKSNTP